MKASSEFALYHQAKREPIRLEILKVHKDGSVDLGRDGAVIVSECQVVKEPEVGCCTPEARPKTPKPAPQPQQPLQEPQGPESADDETPGDEKTSGDSDAPVGARPPAK